MVDTISTFRRSSTCNWLTLFTTVLFNYLQYKHIPEIVFSDCVHSSLVSQQVVYNDWIDYCNIKPNVEESLPVLHCTAKHVVI